MAEIYFTVYNKTSPKGNVITIMEIEGAIGDSAAVDIFEKKVTELVNDNNHNLILKMNKLRYINSSSMGILIKFIDILKEKKGGLVLAESSTDVKNPISLLGLDSVIQMVDTEEEAIQLLDGSATTKTEPKTDIISKDASIKKTEEKKKQDKVKPKEEMKVDIAKKAPTVSVMMITPAEDLFEKIMRKKFSKKQAKVAVFHSADDAESALASKSFDLIIVDELVKNSKELINKLKRNKNTSMIPLLKIYAEGASFEQSDGLTLRENNKLQEPFDLDQLSELSLIEYDKIAKRKQDTEQYVQFQFNSRQQDIEKVNDLILDLMRQTGLEDKAAMSLGAAFREGTDNANRHGNKSQEDRKVTVEYILQKHKVYIHIKDEGDGFDWKHYMGIAEDKSAAQRSRERTAKGKRGGLGIMLMMKCTNEIRYNEKGNELTLIKTRE